jgi:C4-dicarboxylate-specific signal transduction histidine kinase
VETLLHILHTVAETVSRSLDVDEVLRTALDALTHVTGHETSSLHLLSPDNTTLYLRGERGLSAELRAVNERLPVGEGVIGHVAASGQTFHVFDAATSPHTLQRARPVVQRDGIRGFVCVPIHSRGKVLGTLSLGRRTEAPFDDGEIALLEATADQIGIALDNARLYSELSQRFEELKSAQAQLVHVEKLSAVGELASGVAHEINNPLTTILGQVYLILEHEGVDDYVRKKLNIIAEETSRTARIVQNLLLFARRYGAERRLCALSDQVQRVLDLKAYQLERDRIRVVLDFGECPLVWADENRIQQVLLNLIQNAHQAMTTEPGDRVLTIRIGAHGPAARIEVRDTGPGIAPDVMPKIFDPFFTTKPPGEGSGLGLSVSYGIVGEHGGTLRAENLPGGGACFVIELPAGETRR